MSASDDFPSTLQGHPSCQVSQRERTHLTQEEPHTLIHRGSQSLPGCFHLCLRLHLFGVEIVTGLLPLLVTVLGGGEGGELLGDALRGGEGNPIVDEAEVG